MPLTIKQKEAIFEKSKEITLSVFNKLGKNVGIPKEFIVNQFIPVSYAKAMKKDFSNCKNKEALVVQELNSMGIRGKLALTHGKCITKAAELLVTKTTEASEEQYINHFVKAMNTTIVPS